MGYSLRNFWGCMWGGGGRDVLFSAALFAARNRKRGLQLCKRPGELRPLTNTKIILTECFLGRYVIVQRVGTFCHNLISRVSRTDFDIRTFFDFIKSVVL